MKACQTELDCAHCGQVTGHTVVYASYYIKRVVCHHCKHVTRKSALKLLWYYTHDLPERGFLLTRRLKHEASRHPFSFVLSLPRRMAYKPIEVFRELADLYFA